MTLSTMANNILKFCPGLNLDIIKSNLQDSYRQLCARDWARLQYMRQVTTAAPYTTGTVAVSSGGVVTPTVGVFSAAMVGRFMRVYYDDSFFEIASYDAVGGTVTLTNWPGTTVAAGESYSIFKTIYTVDSGFGQVFNVIYQLPLLKRSQAYFNKIDPSRTGTGSSPTYWAFAGFASTGAINIEIYPVPSQVLTLRIEGKRKADTLTDSSVPYLPEDLLEAHALINCYRLKDFDAPKQGWAERALIQASPDNPIGFPALLSLYEDEDRDMDAHHQKVIDATDDPIIPSDDNFALSHDVE